MTKAVWLAVVRREFETLPGNLQEIATARALGRSVFFWDQLTSDQLDRLWGAARAVALLSGVSP